MRQFFGRQFSEGQSRTIRAKKNVAALFVLRGVSILVNFVLVPLTLSYLTPLKYGIWLTLSSIIGWVGVLDIGLGNGLRNKFAEAMASNDRDLARVYVSTTYIFIGAIVAVALLVFWIVSPFFDWSAILNAPADLGPELSALALAVFTFFCVRLVVGLISTILVADQKPALASALEVASNVLSLIVVYILRAVSHGSLFWLGCLFSMLSALVPLAANFWFFRRQYSSVAPSRSYLRTAYAKELVGLGVQFFALQMAGVVIFSSTNVIIAQLFGPAEVTPYNIAFKYFSIASVGFVLVITPFWSASTEAFVRGDRDWILRAIRRLKQTWLLLFVVVLAMLAAADWVYSVWVGESVRVPFTLSLFMAAYVLIVAWSNIFAYFINGTGKIRLQLYAATAIAIIVIPLSVMLAKGAGLGTAGVVLATCLCLFPSCFLWPIQVKRIIEGKAQGIWGK